ncbi:receptor-type tyrosine-protein phosphatase eta-like isoform X2 [Xyrauchen texanus]|uniref:receptor-type tyrosine-protein phosphatase eta-like isoform X2 n=1 Tax=Xyrauchen texanus TaxID=154827 RepID=UPI00224285DF|nr:receptor-type tyrosine-protein phosphatase eta-like isoform X2 [Xyrauchen texanus]
MNMLWLPFLVLVIRAEEQYFLLYSGTNDTFGTNGTIGTNGTNGTIGTTWDDARLYCQVCYKELATVTSRNVHLITQNLISDYWIGLRMSFNGSIPWSRWSNGDPVTYQNWYPGRPVPKKVIPKCSSTTQTPLSTLMTSPETTPVTTPMTSPETTPVTSPMTSTMTSGTPLVATTSNNTEDYCPLLTKILLCLNLSSDELDAQYYIHDPPQSTPIHPQTVTSSATTSSTASATPSSTHSVTTSGTPDNTSFSTTSFSTTGSPCSTEPDQVPDEYIEDACVALLSFGMWKEKQCYELLPFICYDERFFGDINVTNETSHEGYLYWSEGPGENISLYRVEVTGDHNQTFNETGLSKQIVNLTAGTRYNVQVFPVKCGRDLNPQNVSFYTKPSGVNNLTVERVTNDSVKLNWTKPEGNYDFYSIQVSSIFGTQKFETDVITGLIPGNKYNFKVIAIVNKTTEGTPSNVSTYTKPSRVSNLKSGNNDSEVITASWILPVGNASGYYYCIDVTNSTNNLTNSECNITTNMFIKVTGKTPGTKHCLSVVALTDDKNISGEMVQIDAYTIPNSVTLDLKSSNRTIEAKWNLTDNYDTFNVTIEPPDAEPVNIMYLNYTFTGLKAGVKYTITVVTLVRNGPKSSATTKSIYTLPTSPRLAKAFPLGSNAINLTWEAPEESEGASNITYEVTYSSAFWGNIKTMNVTSKYIHIENLTSGTRYDFNVCVVADHLKSDPAKTYAVTVPINKTLTFTMLCTTETPLYCGTKEARNDTINKLKNYITNQFNPIYIHWNLNENTGKDDGTMPTAKLVL